MALQEERVGRLFLGTGCGKQLVVGDWEHGGGNGRSFGSPPVLHQRIRGVTTQTNAVSGQSQNCSGNLEISR